MRALRVGVVAAWAVACLVSPDVVGQEPRSLVETPYSPPGYARLLKEYVVKLPLEGGGFETRFDYVRFWETTDQDKIRDDIRAQFLSVDPHALDPKATRAWAVNAYNFLIIDLVMENLVTPDGGELKSVADIGQGDFTVFDEERFEISEESYSLNRFEHHFLFGDVDREERRIPKDLDPRFHFALVCAAKGCPALWPEPLVPGRLNEQLASMTRNALQSPRHLQVSGGTVQVSKIFDWYDADFSRGGKREFLKKYAPEDVVRRLENSPARILANLEWDWSLNRP
jgi:hypothetical protein